VRAQVGRSSRVDVLATRSRTFTSAELVAREAALIDAAVGRRGEGAAQLEPGAVERAIARSDRVLNSVQAAAVRAVAGSGNGVDVIEALAGTGKTYTAGVLAELYEDAGYTVVGLRRRRGRRASWPSRPASRRGRLIVECSQSTPAATPTRQRGDLRRNGDGVDASERAAARACRACGGEVIAIGDPGQLASVQAGGWLRTIAERLGAVRLTEVLRQRDPAERLALAALHDGDPGRWIEWATHRTRRGRPDDRSVLEQAVGEWAAGARVTAWIRAC